MNSLERRLDVRDHAVVVVAEGVGQELMRTGLQGGTDDSGNVKLNDVGVFLRDSILGSFNEKGKSCTIKYIDPRYTIRSLPACGIDAEFCLALGQHAVHAGMAGRTNMVVGVWNRLFTHVPIPLVTSGRRQLDPQGEDWQLVMDATGQPERMITGADL